LPRCSAEIANDGRHAGHHRHHLGFGKRCRTGREVHHQRLSGEAGFLRRAGKTHRPHHRTSAWRFQKELDMAIAGTLAYSTHDPRSGFPDNEDGLQVLVVEDDAADAYLIKCALAANPRVGSITRVTDGLQALRAIEEDGVDPDLAIIDLQ